MAEVKTTKHNHDMRVFKAYFNEAKSLAEWMRDGDFEGLELAAQVLETFPDGEGSLFGAPWMQVAIESGNPEAVRWMIAKGISINYTTFDGHPALHTCLRLEGEVKYEILDFLLAEGAELDLLGINGWSALHLAAIRNDERAMAMLLDAGADRSLRANCDNGHTAEEEARALGYPASADFISRYVPNAGR